MKTFRAKYGLMLLGVVLGAVGGFLYWRYVGCQSGHCPIQSSPTLSSLWGALFGGALFQLINNLIHKNHEE